MKERAIFLALCLAVWTYIWLRAIFVPFQSDEVATFLMYIQTGRLIPPDVVWDSNNHLLNSFLAWISYNIFGPSGIVLRLPNILFAPLYFFFTWKLSRLMNQPVLRWAFILAMLCTHFIIEFFAYCRGYGISMALLMGSLYFLIRYLDERSQSNAIKVILCTIFAVSANLTLLPVMYIVFFIIIILEAFRRFSSKTFLSFAYCVLILVLCILPAYYFTWYSFELRAKGAFYYGSVGGNFWQVTIFSLASEISSRFPTTIAYFSGFGFIMTILLSVLLLIRKPGIRTLFHRKIILAVLLTGNIIFVMLVRYFWNVYLPEDRTAMFFLPLFFISFCFALDPAEIIKEPGRKLPPPIIAAVPLLLLPIFFVLHSDLNSSSYGPGQQFPKQFYTTIADAAGTGEFPPTVAAYQARRQQWIWQNYKHGGLMNPLFPADYPNDATDYLIAPESDMARLNEKYTSVDYDRGADVYLYKRKYPLNKIMINQSSLIQTEGEQNNTFYDLLSMDVDSLTGKSLYITLDFIIKSDKAPFEGVFVAEVFDSTRKSVRYEALDLDQLRLRWNRKSDKVHHVLMIHKLPPESKTLAVYFWNKRMAPYSLANGKIGVFSLSD
jgi:hypothetical protein